MVLAVDNDSRAVETYRANFPQTPTYLGDISALSVSECCRLTGIAPGELDIMDGSPPCQGFSTIGQRRFADMRNELFFEYIRLLQGLQPKAFVAENVSGMVRGVMRLVFADCLESMKACGYRVKARLMDAQHFGTPQIRKRIIFIGVRNDLAVAPSFPKAQGRPQSIRQALGLRGEGAVEANNQFRTPRRNLDETCMALTRHPPFLLLGGRRRELTVEECATLSGFPRDWKWRKAAYHLIGNAVPPPFMAAIAAHVRDCVLRTGNPCCRL